jgi:hypothetical protein
MATYDGGVVVHDGGFINLGSNSGSALTGVLSVPSEMYAEIKAFYYSNLWVYVDNTVVGRPESFFVPDGFTLVLYGGGVAKFIDSYVIFKNSGV